MTSISGISASGSHRPHAPSGQDPMANVAKALNLSSDDLKSQLKSGKSMTDIADAQGVSHDDLIAAIKSGMPSNGSSGTDSSEFAEKLASTKGLPFGGPDGAGRASGHHGHGPRGAGGPGGPGGPPSGGSVSGLTDEDKSSKLSDLLGTDVSTVSSAQDLVDLLKSKGVDLGALRSVLDNGDLVDYSA
ncbi:MAG: hypothetical protein QOD41_1085 [Cryptosporangiaceae bacterium]|nr:hypothetical protein [Cryptosporangiaceae bacterium]